jgi:uncharacterized membrane protein
MYLLDAAFSLICHQIPARSPAFAGEVLPLCYRCGGLAAGLLGGAVACFLGKGCARMTSADGRTVVLAAAVAPLTLDGPANGLGLWSTPDGIRLMTGVLAGIALFVIFFSIRRRLPWRTTWRIIPLAMLIAAATIFLLPNLGRTGVALASILAAAAIIAYLWQVIGLAGTGRRADRIRRRTSYPYPAAFRNRGRSVAVTLPLPPEKPPGTTEPSAPIPPKRRQEPPAQQA